MVRAEGLEPPRVSPQEPKSCVSANFTTPAHVLKGWSLTGFWVGGGYSRGVSGFQA